MTIMYIDRDRYVPVDDGSLWSRLASDHGTQEGAYKKTTTQPNSNPAKNKVTCQSCGKVCTKARGNAVLTRSTVVCGKCYDEAKHGPQSSTSNTAPTHDPANCQHLRRDRSPKSTYYQPVAYCLDCWSVGI